MTSQSQASDAADRPVHLLHRLSYRLNDHFTSEAARRGLTPQLAMALGFVEQELSMNELAKCLNAEASNLTGVVDRLEDRGLVARLPDPDDRRVKRVILTTTGHTTLDDLRAAFEDFPPITTLSPADQKQLTRILHRADADATARADTIDARHRRPT